MDDKMLNNNLLGIQMEKEGKINEAIKLYEYNIAHRFEGNHPYDRLAIIYRKNKRFNDEIRVLTKAIDVFEKDVSNDRPDKFPKLDKFKKRLNKAKEIQKRSEESR